MNNVLQLSYLEIKKVGMRPYIYLALLLSAAASIGMGLEVLSGQTFSLRHVFIFFSMVAEWAIIYYGTKVLGEEFSAKTSTIIFTKTVSRKKIIISKILSLAGIGLAFGLVSSLIASVFQYILVDTLTVDFLVQEATYNIISYVLFALLVGSFGTLTSLLTMNATNSLIITLISFQILPALLEMAAEKVSFLKDYLTFIPFYSAISFIEQHQLEQKQLVGVVVGIMVFTVCSILIIDKKDLI